MTDDAIEEIKVVRLELHEELLKIPQYRALVVLDDLIRRLELPKQQEKPVEKILQPVDPVPLPVLTPTPVPAQPLAQPLAQPFLPAATEAQPLPMKEKKLSKPMTQVQALLHILKKKEGPASIGWILAELELMGVGVGGVSPRKTIGVALSSNKELFRRVEFEGNRWMWGLTGKEYPGETTFDHLPAKKFKSMRVVKK